MSVGSCVLDGVTGTIYRWEVNGLSSVLLITIECPLNGFTQSVDFYTHLCTFYTSLQDTH